MSSRSIVLTALLFSACDPLVDGSYPGEELLVLSGKVFQGDTLDIEHAKPALIWSVAQADGRNIVTDAATTITKDDVLFEYELNLFHPPPSHVMQELEEGSYWRTAMGHAIVYADLDGNDVWEPREEPLLGGSMESVVLYAEGVEFDGSARKDAPELSLRPGFQVMDAIDGAPCGDNYEAIRGLVPRGDTESDMELGAMWEFLGDTTCENPFMRFGKDLILGMSCPPAEDLAYFCERPDAFKDALADECWDYCDDLLENQDVSEDLSTCPTSIGDAVEVCRGLNDQLALSEECEDLVCSRIDDHLRIEDFNSCPDAENMLWACKHPVQALNRGVHRGCLMLYCPLGTVKEAEHTPETDPNTSSSSSSSSSSPGDSGHTPATGKDRGDKGSEK